MKVYAAAPPSPPAKAQAGKRAKRLPPRMGQEALFRGERDSVNPCGWRAPPHGAGAYHHTGSSEKLGTVPVSAPPVTRQVSVSPLRYVWIVTLPAPV